MIFDAIVLVAVFISAVIAFLRGFIREMLTIVGVVGGTLAAIFGGPILLPVMNGWLNVPADRGAPMPKVFGMIPADMAAMVISYGLIFLIVVIVLSVLSYFISNAAKALGLGPVDRILGLAFGVARAAVLLSLLYLILHLVSTPKERDGWTILKGSQTRVYLEQSANWIAAQMPENKNHPVDEATKEVRHNLEDGQEKLKQMDALHEAGSKVDAAVNRAKDKFNDMKSDADTPPPSAGDKNGYQGDQRQNLDQLIEKNQ